MKNNEWLIYEPIVTMKNITNRTLEVLILKTNFNETKIKNLFSNISTLNLFELFNLKEDYEKLGYSSDEILIPCLNFSHYFMVF